MREQGEEDIEGQLLSHPVRHKVRVEIRYIDVRKE